jgi:hypothetical protein
VSLTYNGSPAAPAGAGSYAGVASYAGDSNHAAATASGTQVISPAALTVTAASATKLYGAPLPAFSGSYAGFAGGDGPGVVAGTLTFTTVATAASPVGSYIVTPGGVSAANYTLSFAPGTLQITPAPLTIRADDKTMALNGSVPTLTATYSGFVNGDLPASLDTPASLTTANGAGIGTFPIVPAGASDADYAIAFVNGALTVGFATGGPCLGEPGHAILQPINADGSSVFKKGSTAPAKFRVCDAAGASIGAPGTVTSFFLVQTISGTVTTAANEAVDSTTPFNEFRWDASSQQWMFNMATRNLTASRTYVYRITLADGSAIDFRIGLR